MAMVSPGLAFAEEAPEKLSAPARVVRIGSPEDIYDRVNEKGERIGYGYEYLQKIANYTDWIYEYVPCSWTDCFEKLQAGEIDILDAISYTDDRAKTMLFSNLPMGEERYYIFAKLGETDISVSDISSLEGRKIGVLKNHLPEMVLNEWEEKNHVHTQHINVSTKEECLEKLERGEIECFVSVESAYWSEYDLASVTSIGSSGIYFAMNPGRPELKEQIDNAMRRISDEYPMFGTELYQQYFTDTNIPILTKEERMWLAQHGTIRVGFLKNDGGVSTWNANTGEVTGMINDYVHLAEHCLKGQELDFQLVGFDSRDEMPEALHNGNIDMIFYVAQNPYSAEMQGYDLSDTAWILNMAAVTMQERFDEEIENTAAITAGNTVLQSYLSRNYPKWNFVEYGSQREAVNAVRCGKADCLVVESSEVAEYANERKLHSFLLTKPGKASFAVESGNTILLSVLNKTLRTMSTSKLSGAVNVYENDLRKVTITDFIRDNLLTVLLTAGTIVSIVFLIILGLLRKSKLAERKAKEAQQQAEKANAAKSTFLHNMSHDIRTPLNGIMGMLCIMEKAKNDPEKRDDCLKKIESSSRLLLSLINDVLDMARLEAENVPVCSESVNLDQACAEITDTVKFQAEAAGIRVTGEHDDYEGIFVFTNALYLKKILLNLFSNAIKYNKPNGSIHTSMRTINRTQNQITCEFKISDTGVGMQEEFVTNELFTPFVQAETSARSHYAGTGLGMAIVKEIVDKLGGTIHVESKPGVGSTFTVVLTFEIDHNGKAEKQKAIPDADIQGLHLLLVEDNELNAEIAESLLSDQGASVTIAHNGKEAVELFCEKPAGTYDAILMDMMMPVMDGLTATKTIRALARPDAKKIPVIAMTANAFREDAKKCMEAGMNAHLAKPLDIEKVKQTIREQVNAAAHR